MQTSQQLNAPKSTSSASLSQRVVAGVIFLTVFALFAFLRLAADGKIDITLLVNPCGFKQQFGLPCPTCGITTSALAFAQGRIFDSFYIQPAGVFFCCVLVITAVLALLVAVSGVYFGFLKRFFYEVKIKHIILLLFIITIIGWAVTLVRTLTQKP